MANRKHFLASTNWLRFPNDWLVENRKLLAALRRYAELNGIDVLENTRVESLKVNGPTVTGVKTNHGQLDADVAVLATGAWTSDAGQD